MNMSTVFLHRFPALVLAGALLGGFLGGCKEDAPTSLFNPNAPLGAQPAITSITPPSPGLAGVTILTITGANFSPTVSEDFVYFNDAPGTVLTASPTQLTVRPPVLVKDSIRIKIAVLGSSLFSDPPLLYRLDAAYKDVATIVNFGPPWGTAADPLGNLYVSIQGGGIRKFNANDSGTVWAPSGGFTKISSLKIAKNDTLIGALGLRALLAITQGKSPAIYVSLPAGVVLTDFDFDAQGNIWAAGKNTNVYRIAPNKSVKSYPLDASIRSVRFYNGYVYFAGKTNADSLEKVLRYPLDASNDLGAQETYFNFSTSAFGAGGQSVYAINFTSQGDLLLGTDYSDPIIVVHPDKSAEVFYPGIFTPTLHILAWGKGTELVAVKGTASTGAVGSSEKVYRINAQVTGAPYYGRN
jgi:hypothetical protein